jgi:exopolysaccharide biosynthesis polyprenyl glycosylphosphotransferase
LKEQGRRRLLRLSPLGWWLFDMALASVAVVAGYVVSPHVGLFATFDPHRLTVIPCAVTFSLLLPVFAHVAGLHDPLYRRGLLDLAGRTLTVIGLALATLTLGWLLLAFQQVGRYVLVTTAATCFVGMVGTRLAAWSLARNFVQTICFLGGDEFCFESAQFMADHRLPFNIKTILDYEQDEHGTDLSDWAVAHNIDEIVYDAASHLTDDASLLRCLDDGIKISSYSDFVEENFFLVPVEAIDAKWLFSARLDLAHPYYQGLKRFVDILVSVAGLIIMSPLMALAILAIKLESPGPAIYSQLRVGRFNRKFRVHKLRSMVQDAEKEGAQWATTGDDRVTRVGRLLRRTRLDEVPQFWNVLKGEMSLIGPRPERPEFVSMLAKEIPFYVQRHLVQPGVTGWAQINYPYGASVEDALNKLMYDLYYVKHASVGLDLQILLRTLGTLTRGSR